MEDATTKVKSEAHLKADSHLQKNVLFASMKFFKNVKKCFLFHLRSSFRSQDI